MNILHVLSVPFSIPYFLGNQLSHFESLGHNEFVICSESEDLKKFSEFYRFKFYSVEISRSITIIRDIKAVIKVARFIKENEIDIVTGHTPKGAIISMMAAFICRVPKRIYFRHGLVYQTSKGLKKIILILVERLTAMFSTKVVCVSKSLYEQSLIDGLNRKSKQVILNKGTCNGIDVQRFNLDNLNSVSLEKISKEISISKDDFVIGFTGRLVNDKGINELVDAFCLLNRKYSNIKLLLVGMLDTRDALSRETLERIYNTDNIILTGYIDNSYIEYYYALMDIFILPSYREGFPTSTLEASSMKIPIVTTKVTGCIDSILEDKTGIFINHDVDSICRALSKLYLDKNLRIKMGNNGRTFVVNNFAQEIVWDEIEKLYA